MSAAGFTPLPVTWDILRGYNPAQAQWRSSTGLDPYQHLLNWIGNAQRNAYAQGRPLTQEQVNEIARFGTGDMTAMPGTGFNAATYGGEVGSHNLNPGQTAEAVLAGHRASEMPGTWGTGGQQTQVASGPTTLYQHLNMALDPTQETFYQTNPQLLWGQVGHGFAPNWEAPRGDWWRQRYTQAQNDYANASALGGDPNISFTSWLNSQYPQISREFGLLPAAARGESSPFLPAGRPQL